MKGKQIERGDRMSISLIGLRRLSRIEKHLGRGLDIGGALITLGDWEDDILELVRERINTISRYRENTRIDVRQVGLYGIPNEKYATCVAIDRTDFIFYDGILVQIKAWNSERFGKLLIPKDTIVLEDSNNEMKKYRGVQSISGVSTQYIIHKVNKYHKYSVCNASKEATEMYLYDTKAPKRISSEEKKSRLAQALVHRNYIVRELAKRRQ